MFSILQQSDNVLFESLRLPVGRKVFNKIPLAVEQKLFKVPLDGGAPLPETFEEPVELVGVPPVHVDLREHVEPDPVGLNRELLDFPVAPRLLLGELVARKSEDPQPPTLEPFVHVLELRVIRSGVASFGSDVDDQAHFSRVNRKVHFRSRHRRCRKVVEAHCAGCCIG